MSETLFGVPLYTSEHLLVEHRRKLSWGERLFSWPWQPWRTHEVTHTPDPHVYHIRDANCYVTHPANARSMRGES